MIRKANKRGETRNEWLHSLHTFSFGNYYDPQFLGFGHLLVINEDTVKPGFGFATHTHKDMEIISYVIEGTLQHADSMGEELNLKAGEIQRMSAGRGIKHSERNPSKTERLHFLQIWILPKEKGLIPSYEQKKIDKTNNDLILIGSEDGGEGVTIHQAVNLYATYLEPGNSISYTFDQLHYGWLQLIKGSIILNDEIIVAGDGIAILNEEKIAIEGLEKAEFLLFDFNNKDNIKLYE